MNNQLKSLYEEHFQILVDELHKIGMYPEIKPEKGSGCSFPLLTGVLDDSDRIKVMIFGQETNGWGDPKPENDTRTQLEYLIWEYLDFYKRRYSSPWWNTYYQLCESLGIALSQAHWNNVNKLGKYSGVGRPDGRVSELENKHFNVLKEELKIVNPEMCIFMSGPNYDSDIIKKLGSETHFDAVTKEFSSHEFARVVNPCLPYNSYRIYHPGYGTRIQDRWGNQIKERYDRILNYIISNS